MTKNCEFCGRKIIACHPRRLFCNAKCKSAAARGRLPNSGHGHLTKGMQDYWLTAKGYRAIGKRPPRAVMRTDRELGILG